MARFSVTMLAVVIFLLNALNVLAHERSAAGQCFFPNGALAPQDRPCGSGDSTFCCQIGYGCLQNRVCVALPASPDFTSRGVFRRASCGDSRWESWDCPMFCRQAASDQIMDGRMTKCAKSTKGASFCCETDVGCDCDNGFGTVDFDQPNLLVSIIVHDQWPTSTSFVYQPSTAFQASSPTDTTFTTFLIPGVPPADTTRMATTGTISVDTSSLADTISGSTTGAISAAITIGPTITLTGTTTPTDSEEMDSYPTYDYNPNDDSLSDVNPPSNPFTSDEKWIAYTAAVIVPGIALIIVAIVCYKAHKHPSKAKKAELAAWLRQQEMLEDSHGMINGEDRATRLRRFKLLQNERGRGQGMTLLEMRLENERLVGIGMPERYDLNLYDEQGRPIAAGGFVQELGELRRRADSVT